MINIGGMSMCSVVSDSLRSMDGGPPGSSIHGIFQARVLEWVAISFSKGFDLVYKTVITI